MNKKIFIILGLVCCCALAAHAQGGKLLKQVERGVKQAEFVQKASLPSVVNGYLRTPQVIRFTLPSTGEAMRAVRFSRNIAVKKEDLLIPQGTLAVVNPANEIKLFAPDETLPAEIEEGLNAAFEAEFPGFIEFAESVQSAEEAVSAAPWTGLSSYEDQVSLAKDIDAYYGGQSEEILMDRFTNAEVKVYRVPSGDIWYQAKNVYLNPEKDLILFYPAQNDGKIIFGGLEEEAYWRMFYTPMP